MILQFTQVIFVRLQLPEGNGISAANESADGVAAGAIGAILAWRARGGFGPRNYLPQKPLDSCIQFPIQLETQWDVFIFGGLGWRRK